MNVKRFHARTAREALSLAREAFGDDAVVLSTKPCAEGVEVLALASDSVPYVGRPSRGTPAAEPAPPPAVTSPAAAADEAAEGAPASMSTLSFRDYVRDRMLRRRQGDAGVATEAGDASARAPAEAPPVTQPAPRTAPPAPAQAAKPAQATAPESAPAALSAARQVAPEPAAPRADDIPATPSPARGAGDRPLATRAAANDRASSAFDPVAVMAELHAMKGLIEDRFGALAFMDRMQRQPGQARLSQRLLDAGFSPAFTRSVLEQIDASSGDEMYLASRMLETSLATDEHEAAIEDQGGIYALIGATGVGKTTSTAKIAAAFASKHGAANLGLVTLDAYRVAAHEQLRAYGRILGVPVHTAHDRATLDDLLGLLSAKKMVLIDTAGMAQRDERTRELLDTLSHGSIKRLLVVNTAAQGETIDDVMLAYGADRCAGVVLSKMDEAVKLGPALDAVIRHEMKVVGIADGQRVPEDWRRMSAQALVQHALQARPADPYRIDPQDAMLVCAGAPRMTAPSVMSMAA